MTWEQLAFMTAFALVGQVTLTTKFRSLDDRYEVQVDNAENLRYVRHVNDINMLEKVLKDSVKNYADDVTVISGDVNFNNKDLKNRSPVMDVHWSIANRNSTFKNYVDRFIEIYSKIRNTKRVILQINVLSKQLVQPILQYLSAMKFEIAFPMIVHSVLRLDMNEQLQDSESVEPYHFVELVNACSAQNLIVSFELRVGTNTEKYTWRQILDVAEILSMLNHKSILFQIKLPLLSTSLHQITWLMTSRSNIHASLRWKFGNGFEDLMASAALMKYVDKSKIFFDLPDYHRSYTIGKIKHLIHRVPKIPGFESNLVRWRPISNFSPIEALSTALQARSGLALLGYSSTILSTDLPKPKNSTAKILRNKIQIETTVNFSPKDQSSSLNPADKTAFTLYFSNDDRSIGNFDQLENRLSSNSIRLSLNIDGEFFVENLAMNNDQDFSLLIKNQNGQRRQSFYTYYSMDSRNLPEKSTSVVEKISDCFDVKITVDRAVVYFTVIPLKNIFCPGNRPVVDKDGFWSEGQDLDSENGRNFLAKTIKLPIRANGRFKKLYVRKTGHWSVDCLVFDFKYNSSFSSSLNVILYLFVTCLVIFQF